MPTPLELVYQAGLTTGKTTQLPPSIDTRIDLSRIGEMQRTVSQPTSQPVISPPMTGEQIKSLSWTGEIKPQSVNQSTSQPVYEATFGKPSPNVPASTGNPAINGAASIVGGIVGQQVGKSVGQQVGGDLGGMYGEAVGAGIAAAAAAGYTTGNPAAAAVAGSLVATGSLLNSALTAAGEAISASNGEKRAKQALENANKRYELALKNRQNTGNFNTKGSSSDVATQDPTKEYVVQIVLHTPTGDFYKIGANSQPYPYTDAEMLQGGWRFAGGSYTSSRITRTYQSGIYTNVDIDVSGYPTYELLHGGTSVDLYKIIRSDGTVEAPSKAYTPPLDSPKPSPNPATNPNYFPYLPTVVIGGNAADLLDSLTPAYDNRPVSPLKDASLDPPSNTPKTPNPFLGSPTPSSATASNPSSGVSSPNQGVASSNSKQVNLDATRNDVPPSQAKNPLNNPILQPKVQPTQTTPNSPPFADFNTIAAGVIGLGLTTGAIATGIDYLKNLNNQINEQTNAANQRLNAKAGACDAMNSDSCTLPLANKISDKVASNPNIASDAKLNTILANQGLQDIALAELRATMLANFATAFSFFKNQVIDRAVGMLNLALNIHNALMLSETVGKTLGGILDSVISLTPLQFTDATTGQKTTATSALGQSAGALIVNLIGVDNYAKLKEDLAISNRIIKSTTNLFNGLERILNSQSKQAQKTGVDVANIGNALIANNVVNQNSYPKMANSPEANAALPAENVDVVSGKLGLIRQGIAGLNQITKEIRSNVNQIKRIQKDFNSVVDLVNGESKARKQIATQAKNEAKRKAKFKLISIKQIKAKNK